MKLCVFGSTGRTGRQVVRQALERGHSVIAAARSPEALDIQHAALSVVACDVLQPDTLPAAVAGAEAVIVAIGGSGLGDRETRTAGTVNIIAAMALAGADRILIVSTAGVGDSFSQLSPAGQTFVETVIRNAVADHSGQEARARASGLRWTIGRPGGLSDGPRSATYEADPTGQLRIGQISRADVAHFLLNAVEDPRTEGHIYALSDPGTRSM